MEAQKEGPDRVAAMVVGGLAFGRSDWLACGEIPYAE